MIFSASMSAPQICRGPAIDEMARDAAVSATPVQKARSRVRFDPGFCEQRGERLECVVSRDRSGGGVGKELHAPEQCRIGWKSHERFETARQPDVDRAFSAPQVPRRGVDEAKMERVRTPGASGEIDREDEARLIGVRPIPVLLAKIRRSQTVGEIVCDAGAKCDRKFPRVAFRRKMHAGDRQARAAQRDPRQC